MVYTEYFEKILKEGKDILYISLSGGLTSTWQSSKLAATDLMEEYPGQEDFLCGFPCGYRRAGDPYPDRKEKSGKGHEPGGEYRLAGRKQK